MENILFTADPNEFRIFAGLNMNVNDVYAFALHIKNKFVTKKSKLNKDELLNFPERDDQE